MKNWQPNIWRKDYPDIEPNRRVLSMYLQAEYFRKKNRLQYLKSSGKNGRLILYCITGILFCIGLFFVFF